MGTNHSRREKGAQGCLQPDQVFSSWEGSRTNHKVGREEPLAVNDDVL